MHRPLLLLTSLITICCISLGIEYGSSFTIEAINYNGSHGTQSSKLPNKKRLHFNIDNSGVTTTSLANPNSFMNFLEFDSEAEMYNVDKDFGIYGKASLETINSLFLNHLITGGGEEISQINITKRDYFSKEQSKKLFKSAFDVNKKINAVVPESLCVLLDYLDRKKASGNFLVVNTNGRKTVFSFFISQKKSSSVKARVEHVSSLTLETFSADIIDKIIYDWLKAEIKARKPGLRIKFLPEAKSEEEWDVFLDLNEIIADCRSRLWSNFKHLTADEIDFYNSNGKKRAYLSGAVFDMVDLRNVIYAESKNFGIDNFFNKVQTEIENYFNTIENKKAELAEAKKVELDEAKKVELAEAKKVELAEAKEVELDEAKEVELDEAKEVELNEVNILDKDENKKVELDETQSNETKIDETQSNEMRPQIDRSYKTIMIGNEFDLSFCKHLNLNRETFFITEESPASGAAAVSNLDFEIVDPRILFLKDCNIGELFKKNEFSKFKKNIQVMKDAMAIKENLTGWDAFGKKFTFIEGDSVKDLFELLTAEGQLLPEKADKIVSTHKFLTEKNSKLQREFELRNEGIENLKNTIKSTKNELDNLKGKDFSKVWALIEDAEKFIEENNENSKIGYSKFLDLDLKLKTTMKIEDERIRKMDMMKAMEAKKLEKELREAKLKEENEKLKQKELEKDGKDESAKDSFDHADDSFDHAGDVNSSAAETFQKFRGLGSATEENEGSTKEGVLPVVIPNEDVNPELDGKSDL